MTICEGIHHLVQQWRQGQLKTPPRAALTGYELGHFEDLRPVLGSLREEELFCAVIYLAWSETVSSSGETSKAVDLLNQRFPLEKSSFDWSDRFPPFWMVHWAVQVHSVLTPSELISILQRGTTAGGRRMGMAGADEIVVEVAKELMRSGDDSDYPWRLIDELSPDEQRIYSGMKLIESLFQDRTPTDRQLEVAHENVETLVSSVEKDDSLQGPLAELLLAWARTWRDQGDRERTLDLVVEAHQFVKRLPSSDSGPGHPAMRGPWRGRDQVAVEIGLAYIQGEEPDLGEDILGELLKTNDSLTVRADLAEGLVQIEEAPIDRWWPRLVDGMEKKEDMVDEVIDFLRQKRDGTLPKDQSNLMMWGQYLSTAMDLIPLLGKVIAAAHRKGDRPLTLGWRDYLDQILTNVGDSHQALTARVVLAKYWLDKGHGDWADEVMEDVSELYFRWQWERERLDHGESPSTVAPFLEGAGEGGLDLSTCEEIVKRWAQREEFEKARELVATVRDSGERLVLKCQLASLGEESLWDEVEADIKDWEVADSGGLAVRVMEKLARARRWPTLWELAGRLATVQDRGEALHYLAEGMELDEWESPDEVESQIVEVYRELAPSRLASFLLNQWCQSLWQGGRKERALEVFRYHFPEEREDRRPWGVARTYLELAREGRDRTLSRRWTERVHEICMDHGTKEELRQLADQWILLKDRERAIEAVVKGRNMESGEVAEDFVEAVHLAEEEEYDEGYWHELELKALALKGGEGKVLEALADMEERQGEDWDLLMGVRMLLKQTNSLPPGDDEWWPRLDEKVRDLFRDDPDWNYAPLCGLARGWARRGDWEEVDKRLEEINPANRVYGYLEMSRYALEIEEEERGRGFWQQWLIEVGREGANETGRRMGLVHGAEKILEQGGTSREWWEDFAGAVRGFDEGPENFALHLILARGWQATGREKWESEAIDRCRSYLPVVLGNFSGYSGAIVSYFRHIIAASPEKGGDEWNRLVGENFESLSPGDYRDFYSQFFDMWLDDESLPLPDDILVEMSSTLRKCDLWEGAKGELYHKLGRLYQREGDTERAQVQWKLAENLLSHLVHPVYQSRLQLELARSWADVGEVDRVKKLIADLSVIGRAEVAGKLGGRGCGREMIDLVSEFSGANVDREGAFLLALAGAIFDETSEPVEVVTVLVRDFPLSPALWFAAGGVAVRALMREGQSDEGRELLEAMEGWF